MKLVPESTILEKCYYGQTSAIGHILSSMKGY